MFQNLSNGGGGTGGLKDVDNVALIVHTAERIGRKVPIINVVDLIATISYAKVPCCAIVCHLGQTQ